MYQKQIVEGELKLNTSCFRQLQTGESNFIPRILLHLCKTEEEYNTTLKTDAKIIRM